MEKFLNWFQRHRIIRGLMCFVLACLVCFNVMVNPLVEAHAIVLSAAMITFIGSLLVSIGINFATSDMFQRGCISFYQQCSPTIREQTVKFADTVVAAQTQIAALPVAYMIGVRQDAHKIFPPSQTSVKDTSGVVGSDEVWRSFVGSKLSECRFDSRGVPFTIILNKLPAYSPNVSVSTTTLLGNQVSANCSLNSSFFSYEPVIGGNNVTRFIGVSGKTYDYKFYAVQTSAGILVEASENGVYVGGVLVPFSGYFKGLSCVPTVYWKGSSAYLSVDVFISYVTSEEKILETNRGFKTQLNPSTQIGGHISSDCTFGGFADGYTGAVDVPRVGYAPDATIAPDGVMGKALEDILAANPGATINITLPAQDTDLLNGKYEQVLANQQDLIDAIRDLIDAQAGTKPEVVPGETVITGDVAISMGNVALPNLTIPAMVTTVFPFCIPFDVVRAFDVLTAPPKAPRFVIPLKYGKVLDEEIVLELGAFDGLVKFIRWGELFIYTVGLAVATRQFIKW